MSRFWRRVDDTPTMHWWARCDMCRWSGPTERFTTWSKGDAIADICDHQWCDNAELDNQLRMDGWRRHAPANSTEG